MTSFNPAHKSRQSVDWRSRTSQNSPLRVAMIVGGFPSEKRPWVSPFNLRAARGLLEHGLDLIVFQVWTWKPGRPFFQEDVYQGVSIVRWAIPFLPSRLTKLNAFIVNINITSANYIGEFLVNKWLEQADLIHSVSMFPLGVFVSKWAKRLGLPHISQAIGSDLNVGLAVHSRRKIVRHWEETLGGVICNSLELQQKFRTLYPQVENVQTIHRGVPLDVFRPDGPVKGPLADCQPVRFCFLGGFPRGHRGPEFDINTKGGLTVMRAWEHAEPELIKAGAHLLMGGPNSDSDYLRKWRSRLHEPDRVHIIGLLAAEDIASFLRSSDVVLVPSLQEGLPNVPLEAAACGCAVLGSDIGGIPETIIHGTTGFILPKDSAEQWTETVTVLARNPDQVKKMGQAGRTFVEVHFDNRNYAPAIIRLYRHVLGSKAR